LADVTGGQLRLIQKLFGLGSSSVTGATDIDANDLSMVVSVIPEILRRGDSLATQSGWFQGVMRNVHAGADDQESVIDPYAPGVAAVPPYPTVVPAGFDVWLLSASAIRQTGAGDIVEAGLNMNPSGATQGWGVNQAGAQVVAGPRVWLARWDELDAALTGVNANLLTEAGELSVRIGLRIPRQASTLEFHTESAGAATFQVSLVMGIFPESLGQDILV